MLTQEGALYLKSSDVPSDIRGVVRSSDNLYILVLLAESGLAR
jgi:hypothetical protein